MLRHHVRHELLRLVVDVVGVDQDVADVVIEVVTDRADHEGRFLVDQEGALAALGGAVDGAPQLEEVVQVPLEFGCAAADARGARDDGHAVGIFQLVHVLLELGPVFALDASRDAAAARVVGHEDDVAARERHERREGRALVAALFLLDLDQQFLAFPDHVVDAGLVDGHALREVGAGDFLERQEAVAILAVVDKTGFERGLDARHHGFVDIALALFAPFDFDFVVEEFLSIDDCQPAFFSLRGIDQHPLHSVTFLLLASWGRSSKAGLSRKDSQTHDGSTMPGRRFETNGIAADARAYRDGLGKRGKGSWRRARGGPP